jgi:microcin C transport system substrate-binding protein
MRLAARQIVLRFRNVTGDAMRLASLVAALLLLAPIAAGAEPGKVSHGLSLFGDVKYPPDFKHFEYVNPDAPKGGEVRLGALGTFDTLNPFTLRGTPAAAAGMIYDTLMEASQDEPATEYGLVAESVEVGPDWAWVQFNLRKEARWHDGRPITPEDVIFSLETLKTKGRPFFRHYYANIVKAEKVGGNSVKFTFDEKGNRELPQITGQLPVLPKHYWEGRDFEATTLEPPLGSGPYKIAQVEPGRSITVELVPDYWGRDLPVNKGRNNIATMRYDSYRDSSVAIEAFKGHAYDFRLENAARAWATAYDFPATRDGRVVKEMIEHELPAGMQAFAFNTRRPLFQDPRVREAMGYAFDFEWSNKTLFYGQYIRTESYFANSELASRGLPSPAELKYLEPLRGRIPDEVFTKEWQAPKTDGSGNIRPQLREAQKLLQEAGWTVKDGRLVNAKGEPFEFEFLLNAASPDFERIVAPFKQNLERLGIRCTLRSVDVSQYIKRSEEFDFDMMVDSWPESLSPGNEQRNFWSSEAADRQGSQNSIGIKDPAIDQLIDKIIYAPNREELVAATRALDRVLLWGYYVIPNWHINSFRVAYWNRFGKPRIAPKYGLGFPDTWWIDPKADEGLARRQAQEPKKDG